MHKPFITLFFALILCSACFSQTRQIKPLTSPAYLNPIIETKEGASITATTDEEAYSGTEPVKLTIALKNTGTKTFQFPFVDAEWFYQIEVTGPDGKKLPFKKPRSFSDQGLDPNPFSGKPMRPGQTQRAVVWLSNLFDMSVPGSYTVTTSTTFCVGPLNSAKQVSVDIKSELVTVKVTSAPPLSQWLD